MECYFGCGNLGQYRQKNGRIICSIHYTKCPAVAVKIGERSGKARKGRKHSDLSNEKRAIALRGRKRDPRIVAKISESNKRAHAKNPRQAWNKGLKGAQKAWNKGLRKEVDFTPIPTDDPVYSDPKKYRNRVSVRTRATYKQFEKDINPEGHPLGKCGIEGAYQVDHIISVREGFEKGIPIEAISAKENLQVLPWEENIRKYGGTGSRSWMKGKN